MAPKAGRVCTCPMPIFYIAELMLVHTNQLSFSTVWAPKKDIYPVNKEIKKIVRFPFMRIILLNRRFYTELDAHLCFQNQTEIGHNCF